MLEVQTERHAAKINRGASLVLAEPSAVDRQQLGTQTASAHPDVFPVWRYACHIGAAGLVASAIVSTGRIAVFEELYTVRKDESGLAYLKDTVLISVSALDCTAHAALQASRRNRAIEHGGWWAEVAMVVGSGRTYGAAHFERASGPIHDELDYIWSICKGERWRGTAALALLARVPVPCYSLQDWPTGIAEYWTARPGVTMIDMEEGNAKMAYGRGYDWLGCELW